MLASKKTIFAGVAVAAAGALFAASSRTQPYACLLPAAGVRAPPSAASFVLLAWLLNLPEPAATKRKRGLAVVPTTMTTQATASGMHMCGMFRRFTQSWAAEWPPAAGSMPSLVELKRTHRRAVRQALCSSSRPYGGHSGELLQQIRRARSSGELGSGARGPQ